MRDSASGLESGRPVLAPHLHRIEFSAQNLNTRCSVRCSVLEKRKVKTLQKAIKTFLEANFQLLNHHFNVSKYPKVFAQKMKATAKIY